MILKKTLLKIHCFNPNYNNMSEYNTSLIDIIDSLPRLIDDLDVSKIDLQLPLYLQEKSNFAGNIKSISVVGYK